MKIMLFDLQRALLKLYNQKKYNELMAFLLPLAIIALGLLCSLLKKSVIQYGLLLVLVCLLVSFCCLNIVSI